MSVMHGRFRGMHEVLLRAVATRAKGKRMETQNKPEKL